MRVLVHPKISTIEELSMTNNSVWEKTKWKKILSEKYAQSRKFRPRICDCYNHEFPNLCRRSPPLRCPALEFCNETAMHGLKYIVQPKRHFIERIFWIATFLIGLVLSICWIQDVFRKYKENPVIVSFWPVETLVSEIPFPAVTVCNMNRILKSKAVEYIRAARNIDYVPRVNGDQAQDILSDLYYLNHVCSSSKSFTGHIGINISGNGIIDDDLIRKLANFQQNTTSKKTVHDFFRKSSQSCRDMIPLCVWRDNIRNCSDLFKHIETDFGKCCTFNMVPQLLLTTFNNGKNASEKSRKFAAEWNGIGSSLDMEDLIPKTNEQKEKLAEFPLPRRARSAGKTYGLSFLLRPELHEYFCSGSDSLGFRITTHFTTAMPHLIDFGTVIEPNSEAFIQVTPDITMGDDTIRGLPLEIRKCYLKGEFKLKFYRFYTRENCLDECVTNITLDHCGCIRYYMTNDGTRELCGPEKFACTENIRQKILNSREGQYCVQCRATCTEVSYSTATTFTPMQNSLQLWGRDRETMNRDSSIVHLFFSEQSFYPKIRKELFGITDLTASVGGILGLCLGFSALSAVELIYFLTIRPWMQHRRKFFVKTFRKIWNRIIPHPFKITK